MLVRVGLTRFFPVRAEIPKQSEIRVGRSRHVWPTSYVLHYSLLLYPVREDLFTHAILFVAIVHLVYAINPRQSIYAARYSPLIRCSLSSMLS